MFYVIFMVFCSVYVSFYFVDSKIQESPEQQLILNIMSYSHGKMDDERCTLSPVETGQIKSTLTGWHSRRSQTSLYVFL